MQRLGRRRASPRRVYVAEEDGQFVAFVALGADSVEQLYVLPGAAEGAPDPAAPQLSYREAKARTLDAFERRFLTELMMGGTGQVADAARRARMDRVFLTKLLRKHGIKG